MSRLEQAIIKYPNIDWTILKSFDPSPNFKYLDFIGKNHSYCIANKLRQLLIKFEQKKNVLPEKDINKYTAKSLEEALEKLELSRKETKSTGVVEVIDPRIPKEIKIYLLEGYRAAKQYCAGTKWCISKKSTFYDYCSDGNLYVILKGKNKLAANVGTYPNNFELFDIDDDDLDIKTFSLGMKFAGIDCFIEKICKDHYEKYKNIWYDKRGCVKIDKNYLDKILSLEDDIKIIYQQIITDFIEPENDYSYSISKNGKIFLKFVFSLKEDKKYKDLIKTISKDEYNYIEEKGSFADYWKKLEKKAAKDKIGS